MNTKNNQRYQSSEIKLQQAFLELLEVKSASVLTVTDICQQADLNRTTFYTHYQDIPMLVRAIAAQLEKDFAESAAAGTDYNDLLTSLLMYMKQHKKFYQNYFDCCKDALPWKEFLPLWGPVMRTQSQRLRSTDEASCLYDLAFYQAGVTSLLRKWIKDGCPEAVEEMVEVLKYCLPQARPD